MIFPRRTRPEYERVTRPSEQRRDVSSLRACATVFPFTFGTTQRVRVDGCLGPGNVGGNGEPSHGGDAWV
jgi:hypothetical protein